MQDNERDGVTVVRRGEVFRANVCFRGQQITVGDTFPTHMEAKEAGKHKLQALRAVFLR